MSEAKWSAPLPQYGNENVVKVRPVRILSLFSHRDGLETGGQTYVFTLFTHTGDGLF